MTLNSRVRPYRAHVYSDARLPYAHRYVPCPPRRQLDIDTLASFFAAGPLTASPPHGGATHPTYSAAHQPPSSTNMETAAVVVLLGPNRPFQLSDSLSSWPSWIPKGCSRPSGQDVLAQQLLHRPILLMFALIRAPLQQCIDFALALLWQHLSAFAHLRQHVRYQ